MSFAQQSADLQYDANVASAGGLLTITASGTTLYDLLRPGVSYTCIADLPTNVTNITPTDPNNPEVLTPGILDLTGAPGAEVVLTFIMPSKLLPTVGIGEINMTYDNQSASVVDINNSGLPVHFFNPQNGQTIQMDAAGTAQIWLGGNPSVSADAADGDVFTGFALVTAEYTGL
jgi:hypothetical protein